MSVQTGLTVAPGGLVISRPAADDFRLDGLRPYAAYRDFGFAQTTRGAMAAHVLRFLPGYAADVAGKRHVHDVDFQMVYLFKGQISYEFEGVGPITMRPGDAWTQPPGIRHTVTGYSDDCELMELVMPVEYHTIDVDPAGTTLDAETPIHHLLTRNTAPQRFVVSRADGAVKSRSGGSIRDFGFEAATNGLIHGCERHVTGSSDSTLVDVDATRLGYLLEGMADIAFDGAPAETMQPGTCWLEPPGTRRDIATSAQGCRLLELTFRALNQFQPIRS